MISPTTREYPAQHFGTAFRASFDTRLLELIILPTEKCNFRCTYCYEDFVIGRMQPEVRSGLKRLLESRAPELRQLKLGWFGGEPTLALDVVEELCRFAKELAERYGFLFSSSMTTNGYLLDQCFDRLLGWGVTEYQISLDGPKEYHDRTRLRANKSGTFDRIWQNLLMLREKPGRFHVILRLHMNPQNVGALYSFVPVLDRELLQDHRFSLLFAPVEHLGGPHDDDFNILNGAEEARHIRGLRSLLSSDLLHEAEVADEMPYVCYASKPNSFVIRSTGAICKCTVALNDPANLIGRLMPTGEMIIDREKLFPWLRGWESRSGSDLYCPLAGMKKCDGCAAR